MESELHTTQRLVSRRSQFSSSLSLAMARAPLAIDWQSIHDDNDDDEEVPELHVVPSSTCAVPTELAEMSDQGLRDKIGRIRALDTTRLPDGGERLRSNLAQCQEELRRRERNAAAVTPAQKVVRAQEKGSLSHSSARGLFYKCTDKNFILKKISKSLSVNRFNDKENAFESDLFLLGRDKSKTTEKAKRLQASREPPSRSFSDRGNNREKGKEQNYSKKDPSRSLPDRIRSCVNSAGYKDLTAHFVSKRRKVSKSAGPLDADSEKVTEMVILDDDDIEAPEQASDKEVTDKQKENKLYYPSRNDPEAIELGSSDIKCLKPCEYLSSPVMNFYIQFLKQSHRQTSRSVQSFHIFNTYFYQKLEEAFDGKDEQNSFTKLRRWWKDVNIFEKTYIILPIHGSLHWSLAIICIPEEESQSGPIILHLDSLGCHSSSLIFSNIERYLKKEWHHVTQSNPQSSLHQIQKEKVSVPQQKNEYDCGLFVLYFIERFITDAPDRFINDDLSMFNRKWFKPEEASSLRRSIKRLIYKELENVQMQDGTKDLQTDCCSSDSDRQ